MRSLIFGTRRFDRSSIPCELADLSQWPGVDDSALDGDDKKRIKQRVLAITLFVEGTVSLREIGRQTGVRVNDLYRLLGRCIACHEDGRIYGFRALLPWLHIEGYERRAPVPASGKGSASGAFRQLLNRYPNIDRWIRRKVAGRSKPMTRLEEVPRQIWRLHAGFLAECRKAGIKANEYPFNQVHLGERSLASYVRKLQHQKFNDAAAATGAQQITHPWNDDPKYVRKPATYPYQVVEFDGHKIDVRLTLRVDDPFGFETLMLLGRIWILVLIDVASRAVIGYTLVPGREYTRDDVAQALQAALMPHVLRQTKIPALKVRAGGGFPSEVIPQTAWACWDTFRFDAAKSHLANATLDRLTTMIGCATDNGLHWARRTSALSSSAFLISLLRISLIVFLRPPAVMCTRSNGRFVM
ncbi:hypothetical protein [Paraburkholderia youngii]|uniref:hypothetical protein n=1 Tax=Paraburkholderia youngii TaxID=2782701 RepID=UPI003D25277B